MSADLIDLIAFSIAERCFARQEPCWTVLRVPPRHHQQSTEPKAEMRALEDALRPGREP